MTGVLFSESITSFSAVTCDLKSVEIQVAYAKHTQDLEKEAPTCTCRSRYMYMYMCICTYMYMRMYM